MKRFTLLVFLSLIGLFAKAQYNTFNPYGYAAISEETKETYRLNNIRFDEKTIMKNPEAWSAYNNYLAQNAEYGKQSKLYKNIMWAGIGLMSLSSIPLTVYSYDTRRKAASYLGVGILCVGDIMACVGLCGYYIKNSKLKVNKKEFIYYLKANHNGIGIVSVF